MSYDRSDLGYELGYETDSSRPQSVILQQAAFPESSKTHYSMTSPRVGESSGVGVGDILDKFGINNSNKQESTGATDDPWDSNYQKLPAEPTPPPPAPAPAAPIPTEAAPAAPTVPAAPPSNSNIEKVEVSPDKKSVKVTYKGDQKENPPVEMGLASAQRAPEINAFLPQELQRKIRPSTPDRNKDYGHVAKGRYVPTPEIPAGNKLGHDIAPDQTPATVPVLKKFGAGNEAEAGAYLRLYPYPTAKTRAGLNPKKLKDEQARWQTHLEKTELAALRQEVRAKEVDRELKEYRDLGIPPAFALSRLKAEGKIEWTGGMPSEWPKKGEPAISAATLTIPETWVPGKSAAFSEAEKAELGKIPLPAKKDDPNLRTAAFDKQTQRIQIYQRWSEQMVKGQGWTQAQADSVIQKLVEKERLGALDPAKVEAYFFAPSSDASRAVGSARPAGQTADGSARVPSIGAQAIRFDQQLSKDYKPGTQYDALSTAAIEVHQETVAATPEAKRAQGLTASAGAAASKPPVAPSGSSVKPPELHGDKWLKRWDQLDEYAGSATDKAFAEAGLSTGNAPSAQQVAWKLPGASALQESDPKINDALALERNRMRALGFSDPEIAGHQEKHEGRSLEQIQGTFVPSHEVGWNGAEVSDKKKALEKYRAEFKAGDEALAAEGERMKSIGFTDAEVREYQRQNSERKAEEISKSFGSTDGDKGLAATRDQLRAAAVDDVRQSLQKIDPQLQDEAARLMAAQLYRERTGGAFDDKNANVDSMVAKRGDVQDDLRFISENPDRLAKLKERAAGHEVLAYYADARTLGKDDKYLKDFYGETAAGQENLELYAASRGIDMKDAVQVAKLREQITRDQLGEFANTYADTSPGEPRNQARAALQERYSASVSGEGSRQKPDFRGMSAKDKAQMEAQIYMKQLDQDYATTAEKRKHEWDKEDKQVERDYNTKMKSLEYKQQLKQMILQHEMQKDQALFQNLLQLGSQQIGQITQGLNQALQANLQTMSQTSMQLLLQGAPASGKDIYLAMVQKGRYA